MLGLTSRSPVQRRAVRWAGTVLAVVGVTVAGVAATVPAQATVGAASMTVTAAATPTDGDFSIDDVTVSEGDSGTTNFVFTVSRTESFFLFQTVDFQTLAGTATADDDFQSTSGTVSFPLAIPALTITIPVVGDTAVEADETFYIALSNPTGGTIDDGIGLGTITNDDVDLGTDVGVTVADDPDPVAVGAELTYAITVSNSASGASAEVEVSDDLPNDVTLVSASSTSGSCSTGSTVVCDLGAVPAGALETVTVVVVPQRTGALANLVTVTSSVTDSDPSNDSVTTLTDVTPALNGCTIIGGSSDDVLVGTPDDDVICGYGGDDTLAGGNGDDELRGGSGDDILSGEAGYDNLYGNGGSDTLAGGADFDYLDGGGGYDTVSYADNAGFVYVDLADGYAVEDDGCRIVRSCSTPTGEGETIISAAGVTGSDYSDTIRGDSGPNKLSGGDGDDTLSGFAKHDTLDGGDGTDTLNGGRNNDTCTTGETLTRCEA